MTTRRTVLKTAVGGLALSTVRLPGVHAGLPSGAIESAALDALPGKRALIKRSFRPPNYETPVEDLGAAITPNDRFFVRWHLANIPTVNARSWRLRVGGEAAASPLELTLTQLRREFHPAELVAVCQCAGHQRGLAEPHVPGVQWGAGAVGNARWRGVRLRDLLARAGLMRQAIEIAFDGADAPVIAQTPDFMKSLPVDKALDENTLVAYEMNGSPLPAWNGFPVRLIVPGWAATYWVKQLTSVRALARPLSNFWMSTGYRVPTAIYPSTGEFRSQDSATSTPVTQIDVNSLVTSLRTGERLESGRPASLRGIAWDSGQGIARVELSLDGGRQWQSARLGSDLGRFSFRTWTFDFTPRDRGPAVILCRATSGRGIVQPETWRANPSGYHNNVIQRLEVHVA